MHDHDMHDMHDMHDEYGRGRCHATTRAGERCGNPPMRGGRVCRMHGGAAPQVRAAAKRRAAMAMIHAELAANSGAVIEAQERHQLARETVRSAPHAVRDALVVEVLRALRVGVEPLDLDADQERDVLTRACGALFDALYMWELIGAGAALD